MMLSDIELKTRTEAQNSNVQEFWKLLSNVDAATLSALIAEQKVLSENEGWLAGSQNCPL